MPDSVTAAAPPAPAPSRAYRRYVLVLLTLVYTFNFIDRQIMGILAPYIKKDLDLSDGQLGVLIGFAFAVLYTTLGIPVARIADRTNRVNVVALALAIWSGFTALSGMAQGFAQLALARVGVGVGEAGCSPPSHSIISDLYPRERRAGALSVYALGIPIGVTLAYLGAGALLRTFTWRETFVVLGLPGIALAVLVRLTVREPVRGAAEGAPRPSGADTRTGTLGRAARHLLSIPSYRWVVAGLTAGSFGGYAIGGWIVAFFERVHPDLPLSQVLFWLGLVSGTAYVAGVFLGGRVVDRFARVNEAAYGWVPAITLLLNVPFFVGALWVDDPYWSLALWWPQQLLLGAYLGPCFALAQTLAPVSIRALSTAIFFFILNLVALGLGPTTVGFLSDALRESAGADQSLRVALSTLVVAFGLAIAFFLRLARTVREDWSRAVG